MTLVPQLYEQAVDTAKQGYIDDLKFAASHKIWLFSGSLDIVVYPMAMVNLQTFYNNWIDPANIVANFSTPAGHGFPVMSYELPCAYSETTGTTYSGTPNIIQCGMDTAGAILSHIYGELKAAKTPNNGHLYVFDQREYLAVADFNMSSMAPYGYVYVPSYCKSNSGCKVHVMLHGCNQNYDLTQGQIIVATGYLGWAEANHMIIIFPQATATVTTNPNACWDWWGYTNANYAFKSGTQMKAIYDMVQKLPGKYSGAIENIVISLYMILLLVI